MSRLCRVFDFASWKLPNCGFYRLIDPVLYRLGFVSQEAVIFLLDVVDDFADLRLNQQGITAFSAVNR